MHFEVEFATEPRYIRVAYWLYQQQRLISAREAAEIFGVSPWALGEDFAKIRRLPDIFLLEERKVPSSGGLQSLIRVRHIYPYAFDSQQQPYRVAGNAALRNTPLTWKDLLLRPWHQLVQMNQSCEVE